VGTSTGWESPSLNHRAVCLLLAAASFEFYILILFCTQFCPTNASDGDKHHARPCTGAHYSEESRPMSSREYSQCLTEIQLGYASCIQASRSCFQCAMMAHIFFTKIGSYALLVGGAHMISLAIQSSFTSTARCSICLHHSTLFTIIPWIPDLGRLLCTMRAVASAPPSSFLSRSHWLVPSFSFLFSMFGTVDDDFDELAPMVIIDELFSSSLQERFHNRTLQVNRVPPLCQGC